MEIDYSKEVSRFPRKTNILSSLVWLTAITFPSAVLSLVFVPWPIAGLSFGAGILPLFFALWYFKHWNKRDPNRLETEDYRIKKEYIARVVGNIEANDTQLPPANAQLESRIGEGVTK